MAEAQTIRELVVSLGARINRGAIAAVKNFDGVIRDVGASALKVGANLAVMALTMRVLSMRLFQRSYEFGFNRLVDSLDAVAHAGQGAMQWLADFDAGFGVINRQMTESAQQLYRQANALQLTTDEFQQMLFLFQEFGASETDTVQVLTRFGNMAQEALDSTGQFGAYAQEQFRALNIELAELEGRNPLQLLELIAERVKTAQDPQKANAAVYGLLGEEMGVGESLARQILPALQRGASGITELRQKAVDLGLAIEGRLLKAGDKLATQWKTLKVMVNNLVTSIGLELAPVVSILVERLQSWVVTAKDLISVRWRHLADLLRRAAEAADWLVGELDDFQTILTAIAAGAATLKIMAFLAGLAGTLIGVGMTLQFVMFAFSGFTAMFPAAAAAIGTAIATVAGFGAALTAAIAAALGVSGAVATMLLGLGGLWILFAASIPVLITMVALVDDLIALFLGAPSVIGWVLDRLNRSLPQLWPLLVSVAGVLYEIGALIGTVGWEILEGALGAIGDAFRELVQVIERFAPGVGLMFAGWATQLESVAGAIRMVRHAMKDMDKIVADFLGRLPWAAHANLVLPGAASAAFLPALNLGSNIERAVEHQRFERQSMVIEQHNTFNGVDQATQHGVEDAGRSWMREARTAVEGGPI